MLLCSMINYDISRCHGRVNDTQLLYVPVPVPFDQCCVYEYRTVECDT